MSNRTSRNRNQNEARRQLAARKQFPLHMRGMDFHAASDGRKVPGQLDRAKARAAAHASEYPTPPVYRTHVAKVNPAEAVQRPVLRPARELRRAKSKTYLACDCQTWCGGGVATSQAKAA